MTNKTPQWEKDFYKEFLERPYEEGIIYADGELVKAFIKSTLEEVKKNFTIDENTSDGYHTFKELYEFRKVYNAALFNEWATQGKFNVHKSKKHSDGEDCFGGGWFIVMATLPSGQISNHYELEDWDLFQCEEREKAEEWDGHTAQDVLERLKAQLRAEQRGSEQSLRSVTPEILKIVAKWNEFTSGHDDDWIYDCSFEFFDDLSRGEMVRLMDELKAISDERSEESVAIRERTRIIKALEGLKVEALMHPMQVLDKERVHQLDNYGAGFDSALDQAIKAVEKGNK